jgi:hypothetical protein
MTNATWVCWSTQLIWCNCLTESMLIAVWKRLRRAGPDSRCTRSLSAGASPGATARKVIAVPQRMCKVAGSGKGFMDDSSWPLTLALDGASRLGR